MWNLDNDFARDVLSFGVDNSSLSHADNHKNNFLVLGKGLIHGINESFGSAEKYFSVDFSKANTKLCLSFHYIDDNSLNLKTIMKM